MDCFEAIYRRKSVRNYSSEKLLENELVDIRERIESGLSHGENIEDSDFKEKYVGEITEIDENSLGQIIERFNEVSDEFKELNNPSLNANEDIKLYIKKNTRNSMIMRENIRKYLS